MLDTNPPIEAPVSTDQRRAAAIEQVRQLFDTGLFRRRLTQRIALATESQKPENLPLLYRYLQDLLVPDLQDMGFTCEVIDNPVSDKPPFLLAQRLEVGASCTVLTYGHGDVVNGYDEQWREGLGPWHLVVEGDRWYGRGIADNKAQHSINFAALRQVWLAREGRLGFNIKVLLEMGEEVGSPGLHAFCEHYREALAADVFIASDGPRVSAADPTLFLGARGGLNFDLRVRSHQGAHHSGNWGGLLRNPGVRLIHAIASMVSATGQIKVSGLLPQHLPDSVRKALRVIDVGTDADAPTIDPDWGEPGLTAAEKVFAWNTFEVITFKTGNPEAPVNAIPAHAQAMCQIRYVVGSDRERFLQHIRVHLDALGFTDVEVVQNGEEARATRLDPDHPWVDWAQQSIQKTLGRSAKLLPNLGGSLPNDVFADLLGLPTLWVPHSYPGCSQHAPNEHILGSVTREALALMAGLFWDLGDDTPTA